MLGQNRAVVFIKHHGYNSEQKEADYLEVVSTLSKGIASITALVVGGLLVVAMAIPASAVSGTRIPSQTTSASHATTTSVKQGIHPWPKASPNAMGPGITQVCGGAYGIILFDGSYECMYNYDTYTTSGDPVVEGVATWVPGRIWLHQTAGNGGGSYCGTPDGSYSSMLMFTQGDLNQVLANVQLSVNAANCAPDEADMNIVNQIDGSGPYLGYNAANWAFVGYDTGALPYTQNYYQAGPMGGLDNVTDNRVWLHGTYDGTAYSNCIDPFNGFYAITGTEDNPTTIQATTNDSTC